MGAFLRAVSGRHDTFFGLPGNPVSTQVTFHLFVRTLLAALSGAGAQPPHFAAASLAEDVRVKPGLTRFLPAVLTHALPQPTARIIASQGSGDLAANARANCYAVLQPGCESIWPCRREHRQSFCDSFC